jgi:hypothetical protein
MALINLILNKYVQRIYYVFSEQHKIIQHVTTKEPYNNHLVFGVHQTPEE